MSTVSEIESAVQKLSRSDLKAFRDWFLGFAAAAQDKQFEQDAAKGEHDMRRLASERGLNWDTMTEAQREAFVDDLLHET
jgi:hypothetical protein